MNTPSDPSPRERLGQAAQTLGKWLLDSGREKVVFAESCTAGLVSAELAAVPGISRYLCGSIVTYREPSKSAWLGVDPQLLAQHSAVSQQVTTAMAAGALQRTEEAAWSAAVTGHLGPGAPSDQDGQVFIAIAHRESNESTEVVVSQSAVRLRTLSRRDRQAEAATIVLETIMRDMQRAKKS